MNEDIKSTTINDVTEKTWRLVIWLEKSDTLTILKVLTSLVFIVFFGLFVYWAVRLDGLDTIQQFFQSGNLGDRDALLYFLIPLVTVPTLFSLVSLFLLGSLSRTLSQRERFDTSEIGRRTNEIRAAAQSSSETLCALRSETAAVRSEAERLLRAANSAHVSITTIEGETEVDPFNFTTQMVREAQSEIFILSPSMRNQKREKERVDSPHQKYMDSLICSIDANLAQDQGKKLTYRRLIQLHDDLYDDVRSGKLKLGQANMDIPLFHHAKEVASRSVGDHHLLSAEIKAIPEVVNFPSTLLVDAKYLFFSLPSMSDASLSYKIDLVVEICEGSDKTRIGTEFQKILRRLWTSDESFELKLGHFDYD